MYVRTSQSESAWFTIESGVRQGCVCVGTRLVRHGHGMVAGKNCWHRHKWSVIQSTLIFNVDFVDDVALLAELLVLLVHALKTIGNGIKSCISRVRGELTENKSPSFRQQGG